MVYIFLKFRYIFSYNKSFGFSKWNLEIKRNFKNSLCNGVSLSNIWTINIKEYMHKRRYALIEASLIFNLSYTEKSLFWWDIFPWSLILSASSIIHTNSKFELFSVCFFQHFCLFWTQVYLRADLYLNK